MNLAVVGGTHGNELVGVDVIQHLQSQAPVTHNSYKCFIGNPRAIAQKKRYIDYDLNRSFGEMSYSYGYERIRARELKRQISGQFDLLIDLHTSTANMGLTVILNNSHPVSRQAALYLQYKFPELKIIEEVSLDVQSTHLGGLCPARLTIEVGPIANNVRQFHWVQKTLSLVMALLDWRSEDNNSPDETAIYKMLDYVNYPQPHLWFIHPDFEGTDFQLLSSGTPIFCGLNGQVRLWEGDEVYPFFINEAAYQDMNHAFLIAKKVPSWPV